MKRTKRDIRFRNIRPAELSEGDFAIWARWHQQTPELSSPYFHPAFTQAVATVRQDVRVAILEDADGPAAFFPFQRSGLGFGRPVGGRLSDFHGPIARPGFSIPADRLVRGAGLSAWDFTHLPTSIDGFGCHCRQIVSSPYIDLSHGFDAFLGERRRAKSTTLKQTLRKLRKIERDLGPLRLEADARDAELLETTMAWKSRQYEETGFSDAFSIDWTRQLLHNLHGLRTPEFRGRLSALYAGDALVSLHFGIETKEVLHYWFPAYDPTYGRYSPGLLMVYRLARAMAERGCRRIDLGKGDEDYKHSLGPNAIAVASGSIEAGPLLRGVRAGWRTTREWLKTSRIGAPARATARWLRPARDRQSFQ